MQECSRLAPLSLPCRRPPLPPSQPSTPKVFLSLPQKNLRPTASCLRSPRKVSWHTCSPTPAPTLPLCVQITLLSQVKFSKNDPERIERKREKLDVFVQCLSTTGAYANLPDVREFLGLPREPAEVIMARGSLSRGTVASLDAALAASAALAVSN